MTIASSWDTPPTEDEKKVALWDSPPTEAELHGARLGPGEPQVGAGETFLNKTADALPLGRPVANAAVAGLLTALQPHSSVELTPKAKAEIAAGAAADLVPLNPKDKVSPIGLQERVELLSPHDPKSLLENYRKVRDRFDERTEAGANQNKLAGGVGTGVGTVLGLLAPLPKVSVGAGAVGRVLSNALTAGAYGGVNALTRGKADLTKGEVGQALKDVAGVEGFKKAGEDFSAGNPGRAALDVMGAGATGGALTGGVLGGTIEGAKALGLGELLKRWGIAQGRRVLTNGADQLSKRQAVRPEAVEAALETGAIKPFGTTAGTAGRLEEEVSKADELRTQIISRLAEKGVKGPAAQEVADELVKRGAALEPLNMDDALPKEYLVAAEKLIGKQGNNTNLGLNQAERLKSSLQEQARYGRVEETPLNEVKRDIASVLRKANEQAIEGAAKAAPGDAELQGLAQKFRPAKMAEGNLLEALAAAQRGAARGAQRNAIGVSDKMMATAGLATGNPAPILAAIGHNILNHRGTSTAAAGLYALAKQIAAREGHGDVGRTFELLLNALNQPKDGKPTVSPADYGSAP